MTKDTLPSSHSPDSNPNSHSSCTLTNISSSNSVSTRSSHRASSSSSSSSTGSESLAAVGDSFASISTENQQEDSIRSFAADRIPNATFAAADENVASSHRAGFNYSSSSSSHDLTKHHPVVADSESGTSATTKTTTQESNQSIISSMKQMGSSSGSSSCQNNHDSPNKTGNGAAGHFNSDVEGNLKKSNSAAVGRGETSASSSTSCWSSEKVILLPTTASTTTDSASSFSSENSSSPSISKSPTSDTALDSNHDSRERSPSRKSNAASPKNQRQTMRKSPKKKMNSPRKKSPRSGRKHNGASPSRKQGNDSSFSPSAAGETLSYSGVVTSGNQSNTSTPNVSPKNNQTRTNASSPHMKSHSAARKLKFQQNNSSTEQNASKSQQWSESNTASVLAYSAAAASGIASKSEEGAQQYNNKRNASQQAQKHTHHDTNKSPKKKQKNKRRNSISGRKSRSNSRANSPNNSTPGASPKGGTTSNAHHYNNHSPKHKKFNNKNHRPRGGESSHRREYSNTHSNRSPHRYRKNGAARPFHPTATPHYPPSSFFTQQNISKKVFHQASETIFKISSFLQKNQKLSKYQVYGQHPKLNFNVLHRLLKRSKNGGGTPKNQPTPSPNSQQIKMITVQVLSSTSLCVKSPSSTSTGSAANSVPGENGFALCVSDGFSCMQAFIQTKQKHDSVQQFLKSIQTLCIVRLLRPSVRQMHGARVLYCTGISSVHMPVPLIGNPQNLNKSDRIRFVQPVFSDLGYSFNGDEALHRIIDHMPFKNNRFVDFFEREGLDQKRLQGIDFLLHHKNNLMYAAAAAVSSQTDSNGNVPHNAMEIFEQNIHTFKKRDDELLALFEEKLSGFELEYWLIKQYLQSVVLCWKIQGKLYIYRFENVLLKHNIRAGGTEASIGGVPVNELCDSEYAHLRETLKKNNLNFVVLFTNHRFFEHNAPQRPLPPAPSESAFYSQDNSSQLRRLSRHPQGTAKGSLGVSSMAAVEEIFSRESPSLQPINPLSSSKWTTTQSQFIPLSALLDYLPISIVRHICRPLPQIFNFTENSPDPSFSQFEESIQKLNMIHNLLDFIFFFGKQLFFIHILKSTSNLRELMHLMFPFIDSGKVQGGKRLLGLFRQFLLLNRVDTERFFFSLPRASLGRLLQIFYLDQVLARDANLRQIVNILFDEIDMLGVQSHLRRLNPKLLQHVAQSLGVKSKDLLDEDIILYILGVCFPFVVSPQSKSLWEKSSFLISSQSPYPTVNSGLDSETNNFDIDPPTIDPAGLEESFHNGATSTTPQDTSSFEADPSLNKEANHTEETQHEPPSPGSSSDDHASTSASSEESELNEANTHFTYKSYPTEQSASSRVVGIIVQKQEDHGCIYCLSHDGNSSHYIMFSSSDNNNSGGMKHQQRRMANNFGALSGEEFHIGDLVSFELRYIGNCIRAHRMYLLDRLDLSDEVITDRKSILQMMHSYAAYFKASDHALNAKLDEHSPMAISNSFSPYFAQQRNPAQIIGLFMRDKFSVPVKIADSFSAFADKEYCGVITCVEHTRGEIIEQHTWEKIVFYFDPEDRPSVGDVVLCSIVHIGFVAFATQFSVIDRDSKRLTQEYSEVLDSTFFLVGEIDRLEHERLNEREEHQDKADLQVQTPIHRSVSVESSTPSLRDCDTPPAATDSPQQILESSIERGVLEECGSISKSMKPTEELFDEQIALLDDDSDDEECEFVVNVEE